MVESYMLLKKQIIKIVDAGGNTFTVDDGRHSRRVHRSDLCVITDESVRESLLMLPLQQIASVNDHELIPI